MATYEGSSASVNHVLMISYPGQGHVNPLLRLANLLASNGLFITFSTTESFGKEMKKANNDITDHQPIPVGDHQGAIRFEFFDDEWDFAAENGRNPELYKLNLEVTGKLKLKEMVTKHEGNGRLVCCIINNPFIPWATDVAESLGIPNAVLWVQSCACFAAYYHYHHDLVPFPTQEKPDLDVQLPFMPLLKSDELPSLLHPFTPSESFREIILGQYKNLRHPFCILMDTFQELEHELIQYMSKLCPVKSIGPLFKISTSSESIRGDIMKADDCIEWLDSKPPSTVVYISFGTIVHLKQKQVDEIAYGLLNSKVSFLWVMKPPKIGTGMEPHVLPDGFLEEIGDKGKIVQWSPQEQVLAHSSIACFLTHCGWNSTVEALTNGVPLLAFPQWSDQVTNAKYLVDVFKVAIRMCRGEAENRIIPRDEVEKCFREGTSGLKAVEMKENALKWKNKAKEAVVEGGSSVKNMQSFVDELKRKCLEMKKSSGVVKFYQEQH